MNEKFEKEPQFLDYYLADLTDRCTKSCYSSLLYFLVDKLKRSNPNFKLNSEDLQQLRENTLRSTENAMNYLYSNAANIEKIYTYHIQKIATLINEPYGLEGYRKTAVAINKNVDFKPVEAREIPSRMMTLMDNYHNVWNDNDFFEREARLHMSLVRMQPFEDGNKRTAQIIMGFNLLRQNYAPILIIEDDKSEYLDLINRNDVKGFANFIKKKSSEEMKCVENLFDKFIDEKVKSM